MSGTNESQGPDFATLLAEFERESPTARRGPRPGQTVKGRILSIGTESLFVDLGGKAEGVLALHEVRDDEGRIHVSVGDEIEAKVMATDDVAGQVVLRRVLRGNDLRAEIATAYQNQIPVEGVVGAVNKGGVEVQIAGHRAFCPISQLELHHIEDAQPYIGQRLLFRITRYEPGPRGRDNLVVSRRVLLEEEARAKAATLRATLVVGAVVKGRVSSIKDYGAFIDLGGLEGLLHVSELGFQRQNHPKDVLAVGQEVEVQVLKIESGDKGERISLSLKSLERDPWADAVERFPEGRRVAGKVVRIEQFGAFVELAPGIEGLVHISELGAGKRLQHARQAVKIGESVEVTVLAVDPVRRRLSLSAAPSGSLDDDEPPVAAAAPAKKERFGTFADLLKGGGKKGR